MEDLTITINCGNAAFGDKPEVEVARILRAMADEITDRGVIYNWPIMDFNGNKVGELKVGENAEPDGWLFVDNETKVEVGFAEPQDYRDARDAVNRFGREFMIGDFGVYFRRNRQLFSCSDESRPEDFD